MDSPPCERPRASPPPACSPPRHLPDKIHFFLPVWTPVRVKDLVMPHRRLAADIRLLPRIPRQPSLGLARNQPPINGRYLVFLCDRQNPLERALKPARHVLGA